MDKYEEMYKTLFNKITDVIEELKKVQQQVEEMYISNEEEEYRVPEGQSFGSFSFARQILTLPRLYGILI